MTAAPRRRGSKASEQTPEGDQIALFTGAENRAGKARRARAPRPVTPQSELFALVGSLVRATGHAHAEVNRRINRKLGLTSRAGAPEAVIVRAVQVAQEWLDSLPPSQSPGQGPGPGPVAESVSPLLPHPPGPERPVSAARQSTGHPPTGEQQQAVEAKRGGQHIALQAGAGTGKTTTLELLARSDPRRGVYLAFNKAIAVEAAGRFPANVACRTGHSLAMRSVGHRYLDRLNAPRQPGWKAGAALGISLNMVVHLGKRKVTNRAISYTAFRTVQRFCHSADEEIRPYHVPRLRGVEAEHLHRQLVQIVLPYARKAWADLQNPDGGVVRFEHDHYLKMWALTRPRIEADFVMLDEAQDTNPVLEEVFLNQRDHAQLIMVGDSAQAIYGWRGARDVMTGFDGRQLTLSQSFRFGPALAAEANRWLAIVESPLRLQGSEAIDTHIGPVERPDAVLCRTNGGTMREILELLAAQKRVAMVGGGAALEALAKAADDLKAGRRTSHPELVLFQSWGELQDYAQYDPAGQDLAALVDVIDEYGVEVVREAISRLQDENSAEVTVSTAHRAKGREWSAVRIAADFEASPGQEFDEYGRPLPQKISPEEARLAYVAITRAREYLDLGGLGWINQHPDGNPVPPLPPTRAVPPPPVAEPASPWDRLGPAPA